MTLSFRQRKHLSIIEIRLRIQSEHFGNILFGSLTAGNRYIHAFLHTMPNNYSYDRTVLTCFDKTDTENPI
jgi:hypothetical protein